MSSPKTASSYALAALPNGAKVLFSTAYQEKMHPGLGPEFEAEHIYVRQLKIHERFPHGDGNFVVWDIGLGAAANALMLLRMTRDFQRPLKLISFDDTTGPLEFALSNVASLDYLANYEISAKELRNRRAIKFDDGSHRVTWELRIADFPSLLSSAEETLPAPDAVMFDPFSPAKNPAMWTLPLFENLHRRLDPSRPCLLATYSRSTLVRVTMLLAGFFVGRGRPTGMKEETTVAATRKELLDEPLDARWLERARKSTSAEPLKDARYRQSSMSPETWKHLQKHPQFA